MNLRFQDYLIKHEIQSQFFTSSKPEQNGVLERKNSTLLDMVRFMMSFGQLSDSFWEYAWETTIKILRIWQQLYSIVIVGSNVHI